MNDKRLGIGIALVAVIVWAINANASDSETINRISIGWHEINASSTEFELMVSVDAYAETNGKRFSEFAGKCYLGRENDSYWIMQPENQLGMGINDKLVDCENDWYYFKVGRVKESDKWALLGLQPRESSSSRNPIIESFWSYNAEFWNPLNLIGMDLLDMLNSKNIVFSIDKLLPSGDVKLSFVNIADEDDNSRLAVDRGTLILRKDFRFAPSSATLIQDVNRDRKEPFEFLCTYELALVDNRVVRSSSESKRSAVSGQGQKDIFRSFISGHTFEVDADKMFLPYYGIKEPSGLRPRYLLAWVGAVGFGLLCIGVVLLLFQRGKLRALGSVSRQGFTLIELVVVAGILSLLSAILLSAVQSAREASRNVQCKSRLRQLALGSIQYHESHLHLPPGQQSLSQPKPYHTWLGEVLPFLEQSVMSMEIEQAYLKSRLPFLNAAHWHMATPMSNFTCPSDWRPTEPQMSRGYYVALTSYVGVAGDNSGSRNGSLYVDSRVRFTDIHDGLSNTILIGERPPSPDMFFGWWYAGTSSLEFGAFDAILNSRETVQFESSYLGGECRDDVVEFGPSNLSDYCGSLHFWSLHPKGANFSRLDGSIMFVTYENANIINVLSTRSGGEAMVSM